MVEEDLDRVETEPLELKGLLGAVGAWAEFGDEQIDEMVRDIYRERRQAQGRVLEDGT